MGFLCRVGVLNKWLTQEESLWLQSRVHLRALHFYSGWVQYYAAYSLGRLYWQSPEEDDLKALKIFLARKEYDKAGERMFRDWCHKRIVLRHAAVAAISGLSRMPGNAQGR